jgi:hypothetical protein
MTFTTFLLFIHAFMHATSATVLERTNTNITVTLPNPVSKATGVYFYTFQKLTEHSTTKEIYNEYVKGFKQLPLYKLFSDVNYQDALERVEIDEWKVEYSDLKLYLRNAVSVAVVRVIGMNAAFRQSKSLVFQILDQIRSTTTWDDFTDYLKVLDDLDLNRVVEQALSGRLAIMELDTTIHIKLPGSLACEFGALSYQFQKIDDSTTIKKVWEEFEYGNNGQKPSKELISLLSRQMDEGGLSSAHVTRWEIGLLMLKERGAIALSVMAILQYDSSLKESDCFNIMDWKKGSLGMMEFLRSLVVIDDPEFWGRITFFFMTLRKDEQIKLSDRIIISHSSAIVKFPQLIADILGINCNFRFIKITHSTVEADLYQEFFLGHAKLGMLIIFLT